MKKYYVISYEGLATYGYVKLSVTKKTQYSSSLGTTHETASKFKYKGVAIFYCKMLNYISIKEIWLKTFYVVGPFEAYRPQNIKAPGIEPDRIKPPISKFDKFVITLMFALPLSFIIGVIILYFYLTYGI